MLRNRLTHGGQPGQHVTREELALPREICNRHVIARDQVAHDLANIGHVVLGV